MNESIKQSRFFVVADLAAVVEIPRRAGEAINAVRVEGAAKVDVRALPVAAVPIDKTRERIFLQAILEIEAKDRAQAKSIASDGISSLDAGVEVTILGCLAYSVLPPEDIAHIGKRVMKFPGVIRYLKALDKANGVAPTESDRAQERAYRYEFAASAQLQNILRALSGPQRDNARPTRADYVRFDEIMRDISRKPGVLALFSGLESQSN